MRYRQDEDWTRIQEISEQLPEPRLQHVKLKERAAAYLGTIHASAPLSKTELRQLLSKAQKMKQSIKKEARAQRQLLEKQLRCAFNTDGRS